MPSSSTSKTSVPGDRPDAEASRRRPGRPGSRTPLLAHRHQLQALGPALDDAVERKLRGLAALDRAVEHLAVGRPAGVVHLDLVPGMGFSVPVPFCKTLVARPVAVFTASAGAAATSAGAGIWGGAGGGPAWQEQELEAVGGVFSFCFAFARERGQERRKGPAGLFFAWGNSCHDPARCQPLSART